MAIESRLILTKWHNPTSIWRHFHVVMASFRCHFELIWSNSSVWMSLCCHFQDLSRIESFWCHYGVIFMSFLVALCSCSWLDQIEVFLCHFDVILMSFYCQFSHLVSHSWPFSHFQVTFGWFLVNWKWFPADSYWISYWLIDLLSRFAHFRLDLFFNQHLIWLVN